MKLSAISTVIMLAGISGAAMAGKPVQTNQIQTMPTITVRQAISECSRPGQAPNRACDVLHQLIEANFTPRELQMVVTWETSHPQYLFDKIYDLHERYKVVVKEYVAALQATDAAKVAAK